MKFHTCYRTRLGGVTKAMEMITLLNKITIEYPTFGIRKH